MKHTPVLLQETLEALQIKPEGFYIDGTAGEGGHSQAIAEKGGKVLALDWDFNQIKNLELRIKNENITFVQSNYGDIENVAKSRNFYPVDGILFDFGLSMRQIAEGNRGFSYKQLEDPLDMRIDPNESQTAADFVNSCSTEELYEIFTSYSEELHSRAIAETIARTRRIKKIETVGDLIGILNKVMEECPRSEDHRKEPMYSRIFQALRILVNHEVENIKKGLEGAVNLIKPDGRIVIITFHSLEDRWVKRFVTEHGNLDFIKVPVRKKFHLRSFEKSATLRVIVKKHE